MLVIEIALGVALGFGLIVAIVKWWHVMLYVLIWGIGCAVSIAVCWFLDSALDLHDHFHPQDFIKLGVFLLILFVCMVIGAIVDR